MEVQSQTLETQQFETTFFNMLNFHKSIVDEIEMNVSIIGEAEIITGNKCFDYLNDYLWNEFDNNLNENLEVPELDRIFSAYQYYYNQYSFVLDKYFRNLYFILELIDESPITNKKKYIAIISAQLSLSEKIQIFYFGLGDNRLDFKVLLDKYRLLINEIEPPDFYEFSHMKY